MSVRVFGRSEYSEPLVELGSTGESDDAEAIYSGDWVELVSFAEDAIHWIVREGEDVDG